MYISTSELACSSTIDFALSINVIVFMILNIFNFIMRIKTQLQNKCGRVNTEYILTRYADFYNKNRRKNNTMDNKRFINDCLKCNDCKRILKGMNQNDREIMIRSTINKLK